MTRVFFIAIASFCLTATGGFSGCAEEGEEGEAPLDCGEHGTEHDGHCHCDDGYLWNGTTCVAADEITEICAEHDGGTAEENHSACACPDDGACPCDHGNIATIGGQDYCVPELHEK